MKSSLIAGAKRPGPVAVGKGGEHDVPMPRSPRAVTELREFADAARSEREASARAPQEFGSLSWDDALGTYRAGTDFGEMHPSARTSAHGVAPEGHTRASDALAHLTISKANIARAEELRRAFARAGDDSNIGERLLEDFVALDAALALSWIDAEAAAIASLHRTLVLDPALAPHLVQTAKEVANASTAVRRRMQEGLAAAADLRARRLSLKRGADGK